MILAFEYKNSDPRMTLREARLKKKITTKDGKERSMRCKDIKEILLKKYGIKVTTDFISKVERGERSCRLEMALAWSNIVGLPVEECFPNEKFIKILKADKKRR